MRSIKRERTCLLYTSVDLMQEMADAMAASQAYSANVTAFNVLKQVAAKGLEIGK